MYPSIEQAGNESLSEPEAMSHVVEFRWLAVV